MIFFLFGCYFILLTWLVMKTPFFKKLPVPTWMLAVLFGIKVAAGIYYGWFFSKMPDYQVQADTWRMFYGSQVETQWLKTDPIHFFADLFQPRYQQDTDMLSSHNSYWNDMKSVLIVKLMALCNMVSGSRYYINVLFFEYLSFFGPVALSRLFISYFPLKKWLIVAGAFLFPSTLLWCSGFHKEGLLLSGLAMAAWAFNQILVAKAARWANWLMIILGLLISFLLRNYLALFFVLWCVPWWVAYQFPKRKAWLFAGVAMLTVIVFFASSYLSERLNLPLRLAQRQEEFLELKGESLVQPQLLKPTVRGYVAAFPKAMSNGFFQPLPWNIKKRSYLPAIVEILLFTFLLIHAMLALQNRGKVKLQPGQLNRGASVLLLFSICFGGTVFLLTGYIIPYLGAIVRYKSVIWPFVVLPLLVLLPRQTGGSQMA